MIVSRSILWTALGLCPFILLGCGEGGSSETVKVTATVTYNGQPVDGATVTFIGDGQHASSGVTDQNGVVRPWTSREGDGVVPGNYRVTVRKVSVKEEFDPSDPEAMITVSQEITHHVPERYGRANSTDLTATVDSGSNEFTFALTD